NAHPDPGFLGRPRQASDVFPLPVPIASLALNIRPITVERNPGNEKREFATQPTSLPHRNSSTHLDLPSYLWYLGYSTAYRNKRFDPANAISKGIFVDEIMQGSWRYTFKTSKPALRDLLHFHLPLEATLNPTRHFYLLLRCHHQGTAPTWSNVLPIHPFTIQDLVIAAKLGCEELLGAGLGGLREWLRSSQERESSNTYLASGSHRGFILNQSMITPPETFKYWSWGLKSPMGGSLDVSRTTITP
ncbi:hypothetical protein BDN72DRAFT_865065, partial [Pluteus cervinus]